jgi:hypothetical protein
MSTAASVQFASAQFRGARRHISLTPPSTSPGGLVAHVERSSAEIAASFPLGGSGRKSSSFSGGSSGRVRTFMQPHRRANRQMIRTEWLQHLRLRDGDPRRVEQMIDLVARPPRRPSGPDHSPTHLRKESEQERTPTVHVTAQHGRQPGSERVTDRSHLARRTV